MDFCYKDLKTIIRVVHSAENLEKFTKFVVFFKVDEDPELLEYLCFNIMKKLAYFTTDEILTMIVNIRHTLTPVALEVV